MPFATLLMAQRKPALATQTSPSDIDLARLRGLTYEPVWRTGRYPRNEML
jgi:hypothetical protein